MFQTFEAVINEVGSIHLLKPIHLKESRRALVTILDEAPEANGQNWRPFGLCAGEFVVPDNFDNPLPDEMMLLFEA